MTNTNKYAGWMADYLKQTDGIVLGRCQEATAAMVAAFPELRLEKGHAICPARARDSLQEEWNRSRDVVARANARARRARRGGNVGGVMVVARRKRKERTCRSYSRV